MWALQESTGSACVAMCRKFMAVIGKLIQATGSTALDHHLADPPLLAQAELRSEQLIASMLTGKRPEDAPLQALLRQRHPLRPLNDPEHPPETPKGSWIPRRPGRQCDSEEAC